MADFQSFLFQNMQAIGLNEDLAAKQNQSKQQMNNSGSFKCSTIKNNSNYNTLNDSKVIKSSVSGVGGARSTDIVSKQPISNNNNDLTNTDMFYNNNTSTVSHHGSGNHSYEQAKSSKFDTLSTSESVSIPNSSSSASSNMLFGGRNNQKAAKMMLFESGDLELEQNCSIIRSDSTSVGVSGVSNDLKSMNRTGNGTSNCSGFKSSTPIVVSDQVMTRPSRNYSIKSHDTERGVKSPQFFRKSKPTGCLPLPPPARSEFSELDEINKSEDDDEEKNEDDDGSDYQISSGFFNKKCRKNMDEESSSDEKNQDDEETGISHSKLTSLIEQELMKNTSRNSMACTDPAFLKDIINKIQRKLNNPSTSKRDEDDEDSTGVHDYHNQEDDEIEGDEDDIDPDDDEDELVEMTNLRELTKSKIPWDGLSEDSCRLLMNAVRCKSFSKDGSVDLPVLYSKNEHKISSSQVKKWYKILESVYESTKCDEEIKPKVAPSSHRNKPSHNQEKTSRKSDTTSSLTESPRSVSKLYTNVLKLKAKASAANSDGKKLPPAGSVLPAPPSLPNKNNQPNHDHFYNEISELDQIRKLRNNNKTEKQQSGKAASMNKSLDSVGAANPDIESEIMKSVNLKRTISNLKSPERQILYNDWFKIVKKMEKDPKFDLETLIRTRGRFTDHEVISYRDKLMLKTMKSNGEANASSGMPKLKPSQSELNLTSGRNHLKQYTAESNRQQHTENKVTGPSSGKPPIDKKSNKNSVPVAAANEANLSSPFKLTLEKSDINYIKDILNKKTSKASVVADLSKMAALNNKKKPKPKTKNRMAKYGQDNEEEEEETNEDNSENEFDTAEDIELNESTSCNRNGMGSNNSNNRNRLPPKQSAIKQSATLSSSGGAEKESNLMSKCKNLCKSETAKTFRDEVNKLKGSIENKLKNLTHHNTSSTSSANGSSSGNGKVHQNIAYNSGRVRTMPRQSSPIVADKKQSGTTSRQTHQSKIDQSNDRPRQYQNSRQPSSENNRHSSLEPKPIPPKRPPPPRPLSPSLTQGLTKKPISLSANNLRGNSGNKKVQELSPVLQSKNKQRSNQSRPPLPPGSNKSKADSSKSSQGKSSPTCNEEALSDIYEFEEEIKYNAKKTNYVGGGKNAKKVNPIYSSDEESEEALTSSSVSLSSFTRSPKFKRKTNLK